MNSNTNLSDDFINPIVAIDATSVNHQINEKFARIEGGEQQVIVSIFSLKLAK
jgi:hypothetical protein